MSTFLQLHLLTSYPPSNPNRDDLGRPKTAIFGGKERMRISSQALKRAWRTGPLFRELGQRGHLGERTRRVGLRAFEMLREAGVDEEDAREWSHAIAKTFAKTDRKNKKEPNQHLETRQLIHVSPSEQQAVEELVGVLAEEGRGPESGELGALLETDLKASDIAMFGRMLADQPSHNVEAAVQVAHALSTHEVVVEEDYFSAVDDLNEKGESGAGHIGEASFASAIFYLYVNVDQDLLVENLSGDRELAAETLEALVRSCAQVGPSGKQNSYGSRCTAHYVLAERGAQTPRQLSVAFLKGDVGEDPVEHATDRLKRTREKMDAAYGTWADEGAYEVDVFGEGDGTLEGLAAFVREGLHA